MGTYLGVGSCPGYYGNYKITILDYKENWHTHYSKDFVSYQDVSVHII